MTSISLVEHFRSDYDPRQLRILAVWGFMAPLVYVATLVIGNILDPTYSQVGRTVSEIYERGAPNTVLLSGMFAFYSLLVIPFGEGLYKGLARSRSTKILFFSLFIIAILGVAWALFFPLDANGGFTSFTGIMHLVLGVPVVFATLLAELAFWKAVKNDTRWASYGTFSVVIFFVNMFAGLATVALINSDIRGLVERFSSGSFLLWIAVLSLKLYRLSPTASKQVHHLDTSRLCSTLIGAPFQGVVKESKLRFNRLRG